jgi:uncharacterized protein (DUF1501 family)
MRFSADTHPISPEFQPATHMSTREQDRESVLRTRRGFIRQAGCAALGSIAISSVIRDFRLINSAMAQGAGSMAFPDYKALVCIHLSGGNDCNNFIVPRGSAYANYAAARQNLAIPESLLQPIAPLNGDGNDYGFHPNCPELAALFNTGKLAVLYNVGPLLFPTDRNKYRNKLVPLPPQLFSHSDQVTHWQTSLPDQPPRSGWGGRIADILHPRQNELLSDPVERAKIALCTSIAGANTFEVGSTVQQYHVSTSGAVTLSGASPASARETAVRNIAKLPQTNLQADAFGDILDNAVATGSILNGAISPTAATVWNTPFPATTLGNQLKMVARMIAGRDALQIKRQIFFVSVGGYDTHTSQLGNTANPGNALFGAHADLLNELSESIHAFQSAMEQLSALPGNNGLPDQVVGFTASDFGRTFPTNGQGSDHGWGAHHIVFGGANAVRGQRIFGTFPTLQINGPDDTSTGRWIPKVSVDEYSATLAKWFGVNSTYMPVVFPNLSRFATPDLGFMHA